MNIVKLSDEDYINLDNVFYISIKGREVLFKSCNNTHFITDFGSEKDVRKWVNLYLTEPKQTMSAKYIIRKVCDFFCIPSDILISSNRNSTVVNARRVTAILLRDFLKLPYPRIGTILNRHHTSIIHLISSKEITLTNEIKKLKEEIENEIGRI